MSTFQELFQQAQLSEAAYANFIDPQTGNVFVDLEKIRNVLISSGFSKDANDPTQSAQATAFLQNWRVVSQFSESGLLNNRFSAALFERLDVNEQPTGQYTLAIAGSTQLVDFAGADLDLAVTGVALNQLVSMVNYVLRLKAGANGVTQQLTPIGTGLTSNYVSGVGPGIDPSQLTVTGHSLGGYLSQVYQRIFGSTGVYTYNALGLVNPNASIFDRVTDLLGLPSGSFSSGSGENLLVSGEPAQLIGIVQGKPQIRVFSETQSTTIDPINTIPAHKMGPLTDSLGIYDLFSKIDPTLNTSDPAVGVGKITYILRAASNKPALSLEAALDSLRKLFNDPNPSALTIAPTVADNREQYYQSLISLQDRIAPYAGTLIIDSIATTTDAQLAGLAQESEAIAYRYALKELNPFAVVGNNAIYDQHNENGDLDLFNATTGTGALTNLYVVDRAEMLTWKNLDYTADGQRNLRSKQPLTYDFTDKTLKDSNGNDLTFRVVGAQQSTVNTPVKIVFGGEQGETITGGDVYVGDHLFGGGGDDTLRGNQGNDYLEGGSGNDTYVWNTGDGFDAILDTDGIGKLEVNGITVSGGIELAQSDYVSTDKVTLHFEGDPIAGGVLIVNGDLRIEDFTSGDLGIVLTDQGSVAATQPTTTTFQGPFGNNVGFGTDGADRFVTTFLDSLFVAKGGDDLLQVSDGTLGPRLAGGSGRDLLIGGNHEGAATLTGDAGQDILLGGPNTDQIFGDFTGFELSDFGFIGSNFVYSEPSPDDPDRVPSGVFFSPHSLDVTDTDILFFNDYFQALKYVLGIDDATDLSSHYDDYMDGGGGNDFLFGGYGSDVLFGGPDDDALEGDGLSLVFNLGIQDSIWRDAVTRLFGQPGDDFLDGGEGNDRLTDRDGGNDVFFGGPGNDVISSADPASETDTFVNFLSGYEGNDQLISDNRSVNGFDTLLGGPGDDTLIVLSGSAYFEGGPGNDLYNIRFPREDRVIVNDYDGAGGFDRIFLSTTHAPTSSPIQLAFTRDGLNLYIGVDGIADIVTVENWFAGPEYRVEQVLLQGRLATPSGTSFYSQNYDVAAIESRFTTATAGADFLWGSSADDQLAGGLGDDTLFGGAGNDVLAGNEGNDILDGGLGDDTYVFNPGDGVDSITDPGGFDTLSFGPGITPDMITLGLGSLLIRVGDSGDAIHIEGFDPNDVLGSGVIELFQFENGIDLTYGELIARGFNLFGTQGDDVIIGTNATDRIRGGAGNNLLQGGRGSDRYLYRQGDGSDTIVEPLDDPGATDVLVLEGLVPQDVTVARRDQDLILSLPGAGAITIQAGAAGGAIETVEFADGTLWDAAMLLSRAASPNRPPQVANFLADQSVLEDTAFTVRLPAGTFADPDAGDVLTYTATRADGAPLPAWLAFDAATQTFSGTPANDDVGSLDVAVTATDLMGASAMDEFQLVVSNGGKGHEVNSVGTNHFDDRGDDHGKRNDERPSKLDDRNHDERDDNRSVQKGDRMADCLAAYVESKPRNDFEALAQELDRSDPHGEALNAQEIARRWQVVGRYVGALSNEHDEDAQGGADYRLNEHGLLGGGSFGDGFGYSGSTGAPHRVATLQTLQGLEEGFQRLHNG